MKLFSGIVWKILVTKIAKDCKNFLFIFFFPFFIFPTILLFVIAKYDVAIRIRPMRSSLLWQKVIKMSQGFPTVGKLRQASKLLADLVIYHDWNWVGLERNDRRYGNRETRANADAYFIGDP